MKYTDDQQADSYQSWQQLQKVPVHRGFFGLAQFSYSFSRN